MGSTEVNWLELCVSASEPKAAFSQTDSLSLFSKTRTAVGRLGSGQLSLEVETSEGASI